MVWGLKECCLLANSWKSLWKYINRAVVLLPPSGQLMDPVAMAWVASCWRLATCISMCLVMPNSSVLFNCLVPTACRCGISTSIVTGSHGALLGLVWDALVTPGFCLAVCVKSLSYWDMRRLCLALISVLKFKSWEDISEIVHQGRILGCIFCTSAAIFLCKIWRYPQFLGRKVNLI